MTRFTKLGLVVAIAALVALPILAKSDPTCSTAPTLTLTKVCTGTAHLHLSWTVPTCDVSIERYAIEVTVDYVATVGGTCGTDGFSETFEYTVDAPTTTLDIPLSDFDLTGETQCDYHVKVKALTSSTGHRPNKSQNNPFSTVKSTTHCIFV